MGNAVKSACKVFYQEIDFLVKPSTIRFDCVAHVENCCLNRSIVDFLDACENFPSSQCLFSSQRKPFVLTALQEGAAVSVTYTYKSTST